jgi:hypothetical protein
VYTLYTMSLRARGARPGPRAFPPNRG